LKEIYMTLKALTLTTLILLFASSTPAQPPTKAETITRPGSEVPSESAATGVPKTPSEKAQSNTTASPTESAGNLKKLDQVMAIADLKPTESQKASGRLDFIQLKNGVKVVGRIEGLAPNSIHGMHIHENGDCSAADAASAGPHFNPKKSAHGILGQTKHAHLGDLGNISADAMGVATIERTFPALRVNKGKDQILGRAVVLHDKEDDLKSQPAGDSGGRISCGVITTMSHPNTETLTQ
jgi:superoxide dismutase, Cu-Zn family